MSSPAEDVEEFLDLLDELESEYPSIWRRGEDFFEDVQAKLNDVKLWIRDVGPPTAAQISAIAGWGRGIKKWHPDYKD